MAPIATAPYSTATNGNARSTRSEEQFWDSTNKNMIRFGGPWSRTRIVSAKGTYLYDANGTAILDWTSGQMSSIFGHGHPEIADVVTKYANQLDHTFSAMVTDPVLDLAEKLTALLPKGLDKCMFLSTGSETNECALKLAKMYTGKWEIVSMSMGYHGMTGAAGAATMSVGRKGYGPLLSGNLAIPAPNAYRSPFRHPDGSYDWLTELDYGFSLVDKMSTGNLAALIIEPIISTGGIITCPPGYFKAVKERCEARGMLLIVDEAQTGMGRTGSMFAFEEEGVVPDILTLSKTLGAGLPLGATITSKEIEQVCHDKGYFYLTTHLNDPLVCGVGAKVCDMVVRDDYPAQARRKGKILKDGLLALQKKYPQIGDVRGRGLLLGVEVVADPVSKTPDHALGSAIADRCMELGLSCNIVNLPAFGGVFRLAPPLTITEEEIAAGLDIMDHAFADVLAQRGGATTAGTKRKVGSTVTSNKASKVVANSAISTGIVNGAAKGTNGV